MQSALTNFIAMWLAIMKLRAKYLSLFFYNGIVCVPTDIPAPGTV